MRSEILIAIIGGLGIGLLIAFGVWRINSSKTIPSEPILNTNGNAPVNTNNDQGVPSSRIVLNDIEDGSIFTSTPITVTGLATKNSSLIFSGERKDYIVKTEEDGTFKVEVDLVKGANRLIFANLDLESNETKELTVLVVYSPEFEDDLIPD